jgi:threonine aldolase
MEKTAVQPHQRNFMGDHCSGICPEVVDAMGRANRDHVASYGDDSWTKHAQDLVRELFEKECLFYPVFNGTAANGLAIATMCESFNRVLCQEHDHMATDACSATSFYTHGLVLQTMGGKHGKLSPELLQRAVTDREGDYHTAKPGALSLTQATRLGTIYNRDEIATLTHIARNANLPVHMDGARFFAAVAALDVKPADISWKAGVDVLCLGGTKCGAAMAEGLVFFNKKLADSFLWRCKQAGQLASKMRFLSAQWAGLLEKNAWMNYARRANSVAKYLHRELENIKEVTILFPSRRTRYLSKCHWR